MIPAEDSAEDSAEDRIKDLGTKMTTKPISPFTLRTALEKLRAGEVAPPKPRRPKTPGEVRFTTVRRRPLVERRV